MKSVEELMAIREKMKGNVVLRNKADGIRVVVGMATCGISAGARPVLNAFVEAVNDLDLAGKVTVTQTGCIGICQFEPVVEVFEEGKEKVTYVNMTAEKARRVAEEHLRDGKPVVDYTINNTSL